tara:strand:- start:24 stop:554 length:531 start_codon:yes stop_codon:yes gene_type:complete
MINFFSYNKKNNSFSLSGIKFDYTPLFLKKNHIKIKELITIKDDKEYSLLRENEERFFDKIKGEPLTISWIMEQHENDPIFMAIIDFLEGGKLTFNIDTLYIQYPQKMDLKKDLSDVLKVIGYFAADEIIDFAENNDGDHNIGCLFGRNSNEICDIDFDDIKQATIDLKERYKDIK